MIKYIFLVLLLGAASGHAEEFQALKEEPKKINCSNNKESVTFDALKSKYTIYDKNSRDIKLIKCEKIQIKDLSFYTLLISSEVMDGTEPQKVLTYEVVVLDKKTNSLKTARSEIVDQIDISGDSVPTQFESTLKIKWGIGAKNKNVQLRIELSEKNEKPKPYLLKFNTKSQWFENIF
ncbi:MAG: hypothetical protein ABL930_03905 [Pseudobdellovibrio sp.]